MAKGPQAVDVLRGPVRLDVNDAKLIDAFERMRPVMVRSAGRILLREATEHIFRPAQGLVPFDRGDLLASGKVLGPTFTETRATVRVSFGKGVPHALVVHEIPPPPRKSLKGGRSARHAPPTGWKFLERPAKAAAQGMNGRLAAALAVELRSGLGA